MPQSKEAERSAAKNKQGQFTLFSEQERRALLAGIAVLLFVVAAVVLLLGSLRPTPLQSCKNIVFSNQKYICIYSLASATNNYSICSLLPGTQPSQCVTALAEKQMNASGCARLGTGPLYGNCMANVSLARDNVSYCLGLNGSNESFCAFGIARHEQFGSISECSDVHNLTLSLLCSYIYYYNAASRLNMPGYCSLLPDVNNGTLLSIVQSRDYANQTALNYQYLTTSEINITVSAACYYNTAIQTSNKTLCGYAGGAISTECYDYLNSTNSTFQFSNATAICKNAPYGLSAACDYALFTEKALAQRNISSCFAIGNSSYQDTCIVELASTYNDSAYCSSITNAIVQQACLSSAAYRTGG